MNPSKAVFLDRDGVLLRIPPGPSPLASARDLSEFELLPGSSEACAALKRAGFLLIVATNQPEVARGRLRLEAVETIHSELRARLPLDDLFVCYHDDADRCSCRKPEPGMILEASRRWSIALPLSFFVGDRWRDVEAGRRAGCRTVLVKSPANDAENHPPDHFADDLPSAVAWILNP